MAFPLHVLITKLLSRNPMANAAGHEGEHQRNGLGFSPDPKGITAGSLGISANYLWRMALSGPQVSMQQHCGLDPGTDSEGPTEADSHGRPGSGGVTQVPYTQYGHHRCESIHFWNSTYTLKRMLKTGKKLRTLISA